MADTVRTTCAYCGVGCGVLADEEGQVRGDDDHPANFGRLCSKGSALGETLGLEERLLSPRISGREAGWDEALDLVAERLRATIAQHGPEALGLACVKENVGTDDRHSPTLRLRRAPAESVVRSRLHSARSRRRGNDPKEVL